MEVDDTAWRRCCKVGCDIVANDGGVECTVRPVFFADLACCCDTVAQRCRRLLLPACNHPDLVPLQDGTFRCTTCHAKLDDLPPRCTALLHHFKEGDAVCLCGELALDHFVCGHDANMRCSQCADLNQMIGGCFPVELQEPLQVLGRTLAEIDKCWSDRFFVKLSTMFENAQTCHKAGKRALL